MRPRRSLVVGLGNPGRHYERTRHNVGFRVVELLADRHGATAWRSKFNGRFAEAASLDALLLMPQTYMNDSGESVAPCADFFKIPPELLLVVCDDINLPFARLRFRRSGSDGGHNGLKSIIMALNTLDFPRLRVGIGRSGPDAIDHVIGAFNKEEEAELPSIIDRAAEGVETFLRDGPDAAIAAVNAFGGGISDLEPES
ncbi:MAG: aminoacyl-tRNA hydrolase [Candidatus Eremiobacteraeota bacterium]|nr:aminoacyl-tRNA hydrolase [Candidatus Eremiobacteraeota bacterium]